MITSSFYFLIFRWNLGYMRWFWIRESFPYPLLLFIFSFVEIARLNNCTFSLPSWRIWLLFGLGLPQPKRKKNKRKRSKLEENFDGYFFFFFFFWWKRTSVVYYDWKRSFSSYLGSSVWKFSLYGHYIYSFFTFSIFVPAFFLLLMDELQKLFVLGDLFP